MSSLAKNHKKSIGQKATQETVFVGLSGGVDSSVAAYLLKKQGYSVVGVFMRCWSGSGSSAGLGINCAERDAEDARRVAGRLGIPFYVWDFEEEYKRRVVEYMVDGYRAGITPNPDVMCNREIKFGLFLEKALAAGADFVATGHYVRIREDRGLSIENRVRKSRKIYPPSSIVYHLSEALDKNKDQSYFLWTLTQQQLQHCLFPIGDYLKPQVREIARRAGLPTAAKKDSQGICFLGQVTIADFLKQYIVEKPGALVTTTGEQIGEHAGAAFYTIGQRHGVGAQGRAQPFYVAEKNLETNTVTVAEGAENPALYRKELALTGLNFISNLQPPTSNLPVFARVRYRQPLTAAVLVKSDGKYKLVFEKPQKFIAPGQSAVCYAKRGEMLGGGVIAE